MNLAVSGNLALALQHKVQSMIGNRVRIDFWLYIDKARDIETFEIIDWFKSKGLFRRNVIAGLHAMWAYKNNDVDALLAEMPDLLKMLEGKISGGGGGELAEINRKLNLILEREITIELPPSQIAAKPAGLKAIAAPSFALPVFEDEDEFPTLKLSKNESGEAGMNFLKSMTSIH